MAFKKDYIRLFKKSLLALDNRVIELKIAMNEFEKELSVVESHVNTIIKEEYEYNKRK
jgi:hypothetical protein|tara:strand:+ start:1220 stop:1393 length:174 start_codon:yes stop_codon:yes gene_type:complete